MKIKNVIKYASLTFAMALGAGIGLIGNSKSSEVKAAAGDVWYLRGTMNDWTVNDDYKIIENGDPLIVDLSAGAQFKVATSNWSIELTTSTGDASGNGITFTEGGNSYVNADGKYAFTVKDGALYADFGEFYYTGTDNDWPKNPETADNHPKVTVNGGAQKWTFVANERFKIINNNWVKGVFGYTSLEDGDFYGSFESEGDNNIKCKLAGDYDVSISLTNREWTVRAVKHGVDPDDTAFVYVLDKYGNLLNSNHYAHVYNASGQTTAWPGATMQKYSEDTNHMYKQEFWVGMETVIFNNETAQSYEWDISTSGAYSRRGKCLILDGSFNYEKWSSETWVEPETAKFIENCMHFANVGESDNTDTGACRGEEGYYAIAKAAYQAESFATFRSELCSLDYVVERLQAWAIANGESFDIEGGVGSFSNARPALLINNLSNTNSTAIIVIISTTISLIAVGGYFLLRRKKEN